MDLMQLTAVELGKRIKNKEVTVKECVEAALAQIDAVEEQIHSFVTIDREGALKKAEEVQAKIDAGELTGPLAGVPVAIKDNMCTEGLLTTCSSKILYNFVPTYTSEAVLNLERAGAVIIGKTNMDEFPWEVRRRHPPLERQKIRGIRPMCRVVPPAVPAPLWPQRKFLMPLAPIRAVRFVSRVPSAALWESSRPMARFPVTVSSPTVHL